MAPASDWIRKTIVVGLARLTIASLLAGFMLFAMPTKACADCIDLSGSQWSRVDSHTMIVYRYSSAVAMLKIPYCYLYATSDIRQIKDYVCNWDKIIVDGEVCDISRVERF